MEKQLLTECAAVKRECFGKGNHNLRPKNSHVANERIQRMEEAIKKEKINADQKLYTSTQHVL